MAKMQMQFNEYENRILKILDDMDKTIDDLVLMERYEDIDTLLFEKSKVEITYINRALKFRNYDEFKYKFNEIIGYDAFRNENKGYLSK